MSSAKNTPKKGTKSSIQSATKEENKAPTEKEADHQLVEEAYTKLEGIVTNHLTMAMLEAGQYIIKRFYDNDYDKARKNQKVKFKSLNKLIKKLQEGSGNSPGKTWIYDAVKLAVDDYDYKNLSAYGKIGHSHKVALTHLKDTEIKKELIEETAKHGHSVSKLKERIKEEKGGIYLSELPSEEDLRKLEPKKLNTIKKQIDWRLKKMEETLEKYKKSQAAVESILNEMGETEAVAVE